MVSIAVALSIAGAVAAGAVPVGQQNAEVGLTYAAVAVQVDAAAAGAEFHDQGVAAASIG